MTHHFQILEIKGYLQRVFCVAERQTTAETQPLAREALTRRLLAEYSCNSVKDRP